MRNMYETEYSSSYRGGVDNYQRGSTASRAYSGRQMEGVASRSLTRNDEENMRRAANTNSASYGHDGYNSDDERGAGPAIINVEFPDDVSFVQALKNRRGWFVEPCKEDGACMFRAVAFHVYGDQEMHGTVRDHCMDYMAKNRDHFRHYVTENFDSYIDRKRSDRCYGNHLELMAMSELYNRDIEVYAYNLEPINTFTAHGGCNAPIRLSYHGNIHYNAIHDPNAPTFGVGLGFAGLKPGDADRQQVAQAKAMSEQATVEQEILESSLKESEEEMLMQAIENSVIAESRKEFWNSKGF